MVGQQGVYTRILGSWWSYRMFPSGYYDTGGATGVLHKDTWIQMELKGVNIRFR